VQFSVENFVDNMHMDHMNF